MLNAKVMFDSKAIVNNLLRSCGKYKEEITRLVINTMYVEIEGKFKKVPRKIIDAISLGNVLEYKFEEDADSEVVMSEEVKETETEEVSSEAEEAKEAETEEVSSEKEEVKEAETEEVSSETEEVKEAETEEVSSETEEVKEVETEEVSSEAEEIKMAESKSEAVYANASEDESYKVGLQRIAGEVNSYDEFLNEVAKWLKLSKTQGSLFVTLVKIRSTMGRCSKTELIELFAKEGLKYNEPNIRHCATKIKEKFENSTEPVTMKDFIKELLKFRNLATDNPIVKKSYKECLEKIAGEVNSYDEFISKIAHWMELGKKETALFVALVRIRSTVGECKRAQLIELLAKEGIEYKESLRNNCSYKVKKSFGDTEEPITMMKFIEKITDYKNFDFEKSSSETKKEESKDEQEISDDSQQENTSTKENNEETDTHEPISNSNIEADIPSENKSEEIQRKSVRLQCMPEIPEFEEFLSKLDLTKPIEQRAIAVLQFMGLNKLAPKEKATAMELISTIATQKIIYTEDEKENVMNFMQIMQNTKIPKNEMINARMQFMKFLNNFIKKYDEQWRSISAHEFLRDLQEILLTEEELKSLK